MSQTYDRGIQAKYVSCFYHNHMLTGVTPTCNAQFYHVLVSAVCICKHAFTHCAILSAFAQNDQQTLRHNAFALKALAHNCTAFVSKGGHPCRSRPTFATRRSRRAGNRIAYAGGGAYVSCAHAHRTRCSSCQTSYCLGSGYPLQLTAQLPRPSAAALPQPRRVAPVAARRAHNLSATHL